LDLAKDSDAVGLRFGPFLEAAKPLLFLVKVAVNEVLEPRFFTIDPACLIFLP